MIGLKNNIKALNNIKAFRDGDPFYSSTRVLLNFQGANGSTSIIDEAAVPGTYTAFGSAQIRTDQFIYGTSSAYFDGTTGSSIRRSSILNVASTQDWTMEGWFRPSEDSRTGTFNGITVRVNSGGENEVLALDFYNPTVSRRRHIFGGVNQSGTAIAINTGASFGVIANTWYYYMITNNVGINQIKLNIGAAGSSLQEFSASGVRSLSLNDIGCYQGAALNGFNDAFFGYIGPTRLTIGVARSPSIPTKLFQSF